MQEELILNSIKIPISIEILKDHLPQRMVKVLIIFSKLSIGSF